MDNSGNDGSAPVVTESDDDDIAVPPAWEGKFSQKDALLVMLMSAGGATQQNMARELNISRTSLRRYFDYEIKNAREYLNSRVFGAMFKNAMAGHFGAQKWWSQIMMGWKETSAVEHSGEITAVLNVTPPKEIDITKPMYEIEYEDDDENWDDE